MQRYIVTTLADVSFFNNNLHIITPTKAIAKTLKASHHSLETLARATVHQQGWMIVSSLLSCRYLQNTVREVIGTKDIKSTSEAFLPTIKELFHTGIDLTKLQQQSSVRLQQLASLAIIYQQKLRSLHYLDEGELFWQGAKNVSKRQSYLFYGYFTASRDELAFINAVAGDGSVIVLPPVEAAGTNLFIHYRNTVDFLQDQGWQFIRSSGRKNCPDLEIKAHNKNSHLGKKLQKSFLNSESLPSGILLHRYSDKITEVRGVLTQVKALLNQGVAATDIVLVTKDEQSYGETLIDVAWEYDLTVRAFYEIPLEVTRMGAWLKLLLEVIETNFSFEATAKLLSHTLVGLMTETTWSQARQTHPQTIQAWQELGIDLSLLDFPQHSRRDVWIQRLQEILVNWEILEHGKSWAREVIAYYRIQAALTELAKPEAEKINREVLIRDLQDTLALLTVPVQPGNGGIELHTPKSLLGTKYQYVFVVGMGDGIFPTKITDDLILDFCDRNLLAKQGLAVTTALEKAQLEVFNFYNLLGIVDKSIIFSYPQLIDRQTILPSPYLQRLGIKPSPIPNLPLASIETTRQFYLHQPQLIADSLISQISKGLAKDCF